jgi:hypothetical protein
VGQTQDTFDLKCGATGTAAMADATSIRTLAQQRIKALVKSGYKVVANSIQTDFGKPVSDGTTVTVPVTASARQVANVDENAIRSAVKGKSLDEARAALAKYGTVDISVTPAWASTMPSFDFRIDVVLVTPPSPSPSVTSSAMPSRSEPPPAPTPPPAAQSAGPSASPSGSAPAASPSPTDTPTPAPPTSTPTPAPSGSAGPSASPSAT